MESFINLLSAFKHLKLIGEGPLIALVSAICLLTVNAADNAVQRSRIGNRRRNRLFAISQMDFISDAEFKIMFRMDRTSFSILENTIEAHLGEPSYEEIRQAVCSSGSPISTRTKLAVTLRWLAGGSYIDLCFTWGIARGTFFNPNGPLWQTIEAIDQVFTIGFPFDDAHALRQMAADFKAFSHGRLEHCVLAIDGWVCKTRCPTALEVDFPLAYRNRKGCFGLVCLAGCDAHLKFHMFSCKCSGGTNDILAWDLSAMKNELDSGALPFPYYFIGDEAFINTNQFLVPWGGHGLDDWKDSFNYHLSAMRQCIERAFALLVQRWGIFWRPLQVSFDRWSLVCSVCAKLHNFCIDMKDGDSNLRFRYHQDMAEGDDAVPLHGDNNNDPDSDGSEQTRSYRTSYSDTRKTLTLSLERNAIRRPPLRR
jgi:hypothetical protein